MNAKLIPLSMDYHVAFPEVVSSSLLSSYQSCPLQFFYNSCLNLKPKATNIHLNAGAAFAASLNVFRRAFYSPHSDTYRDTNMSLAVALRELINSYQVPPGPDEWERLEATPKGLSNLAVALIATVETYNPHDPYGLHPYVDEAGEVWAERSFIFPTQVMHPETDNPILFSGRTDWIGTANNYHYVVDEKTTVQMGPKWADQWSLRGQFIGYTLGFKDTFPELAGVWVRGVCLLKDTIRLQEHPVLVPVWQIRDWYTDLNYALDDMVRDWKRGHFRADRAKACSSYSGCDYLTLCTKPQEHRRSFALPAFEQRVYDPILGEEKPLEKKP